VTSADAGRALLEYYALRFPKRTRDDWSATIAAGQVRIADRVARAGDVLATGDVVEYHRLPWTEPDAPTEFGVAYEDEHVLVALKPAGMQVLAAGPFFEKTLFHLVRASAPDRADASPIHRLGRGTSGLILVGKTKLARVELARQFRERSPTKTYFALVEGVSLPDSCHARHPIGDVAHGPMRLHVAREGGKESWTRVRVLRRDPASARSLVAAQPITGRPDQIRIHLAALGAPIVGDPLFGVGGVAKSDVPPGRGGYHLHAAGIGFVHPASGARMRLRSTPPWTFD
jgi:23S rRNA pseudouridine1911/1915/1917 synthase